MKLSLIPHHHPAPVSNRVPDPDSKPELVLETKPTGVPAHPQLEPKNPSNLELNLHSVHEPLLELTTQKSQSQPSVDFTPPVDLTTFFDPTPPVDLTYSFVQTPPVDIAFPADITSQVDSSGHMILTPQVKSESVQLFAPSTCHLGSSDLLLPAESTAAVVPEESLPQPPVEFQQPVPLKNQASSAMHSEPVLPLPAGPSESVQEGTVDLQQPESYVMPPCSSQPLATLGLSPDILPREAMCLQALADSQPPAPESDLTTQHPVSDLLNTSDCQPEEVSGSGDPNKSRPKEETTLDEVPSPWPVRTSCCCIPV